MAAQASFGITFKVDLQDVDNAINQAKKALAQRYDFKGSKVAGDNFKMEAVWEIVLTRLIVITASGTRSRARFCRIQAATTMVGAALGGDEYLVAVEADAKVGG